MAAVSQPVDEGKRPNKGTQSSSSAPGTSDKGKASDGAGQTEEATSAPPAWIAMSDVDKLEQELDKAAAKLHAKRIEPPDPNALRIAIFLSVGLFVALFVGMSFAFPDISFGENAFVGTTDGANGGSSGGTTATANGETTTGSTSGTDTDASRGESMQFSLIIATSAGLVPAIAYAVFRDSQIQKKNEELAALGLEMKYIRSKILTQRQEKAAANLAARGKESIF